MCLVCFPWQAPLYKIFLAHQIEKSNSLRWVKNSYIPHVISSKNQVLLLLKIGCIQRHVTLLLSWATTTSVFFKMANMFYGKIEFIQAPAPKGMQEKNPR